MGVQGAPAALSCLGVMETAAGLDMQKLHMSVVELQQPGIKVHLRGAFLARAFGLLVWSATEQVQTGKGAN